MAAHPKGSSRLRRWTRFSLRSLILLIALITSGTGLWHQWEPWQRGRLLEGHSGPVVSAAFSPAGKRILTASWDKTASVWDAASGESLVVLEGHSDYVLSAAYSPDGKRIVTASDDHTARVWERRRPECWWGVAWLPQFWRTVVLGVALVWSMIVQRSTFKVQS